MEFFERTPTLNEKISRDLAKYWFLRCVACSEASMTTQMCGFGFEEQVYEQAIHAFSGGFMHRGHACGLLTGVVLAAGFVAQQRFKDDKSKSGAILHTAVELAREFPEYSGFLNCREITEKDLTKLGGRLSYYREGLGKMCGRLHLKWAPRAQELIEKSLMDYKPKSPCANCAVRTMQELGASTRLETWEPTLMAGFAGGIGLSGNVCAALASGVYSMTTNYQISRRKKKRDSQFRGSVEELTGKNYRGTLTNFWLKFTEHFGSVLCIDIIDRHFENVEDHASFVDQGGCENVINFVSKWVSEH
jgi:hypothetical protein